MTPRLVITGIGPVTALGTGKDAVWAGIQKAAPSFGTVRQLIGGEEWASYPLAQVPDADLGSGGVSDNELRGMGPTEATRDLRLFLRAARLAIDDSGLTYQARTNQVGLVISHENPGFDGYTAEIWKALENQGHSQVGILEQIKNVYAQVERAGYNTHAFVLLQQLTALLHSHGPALSVNNACSSGLFALETAAQWLRSGHADVMVVVCGDSPRLITRYLWLKAANTCSVDGLIRPFDKNRSGFVLGEGAAAIVLETLDSAQKRGATIYSEYRGGAFRSDGWKLSLPAVSPHLYGEAIRAALFNCGEDSSAIDLIVPHGAATPIQDRYEADGITQTFGRNPERPLVTALKPFVGHTLAGCSLIELVLALIGISHETVLPTLNWTGDDDKLGLRPVLKHTPGRVKTWMKTATGFGGFNAACVFQQAGGRA